MIYRRFVLQQSASIVFALLTLCIGLVTLETRAGTAFINVTNTLQTIDGFGFSSAWCGTLSGAKNNALYNTLGMSLLRIRIDPNNSWSQETANAAAAHAFGLKVLGSSWTPPASMKDNANIVGGSLLTNQYAAYANWLNQAANSIGLDYVSFQNEPDITVTYDSCDWTPTEILNFVKNYAPAIGKPVVMPESYHFNDTYSDPVINDPVAADHFAILGGHFYGGGNYAHTNALAHGKPVWMTEHYLDNAENDFSVCMNVAKEISDAMNNKSSAYFWWWVNDSDTGINLVLSDGTIFKDGYTLGQFAKFIRPNAVRIGTTYNPTSKVYVTAYQNAGGQVVIVAINMNATAVNQQFTIQNDTVTSMTPYQTSTNESMTALNAITLAGGSFTTPLPAQSITTFVQNIGVSAGPLIHRYSFSEMGGATVADSVSGPAWNGTVFNSGTLANGTLTLAAASSQYANLPAGVVSGLSNFTLMAWVNLNSVSTWSEIFDFGNNTTTCLYLTPQCGGSGTLRFAITTNGPSFEQRIDCSSTLSTGVWHQVAVSLSSGTGILYLDGVAVGTNSGMSLDPAILGTTALNYIGKSQSAGHPYMDGQVDEFRIYNAGLSAAEIAATCALGPDQQLSTNSPAMSTTMAGTNLTLSWPLADAGFTLQSCTDLASGDWVTIPSPVAQIVGTNWQVAIPTSNTNSSIFYRLLK